MKSGNLNFLEPSGPLQVCNGTDFLFFIDVWEHSVVPIFEGQAFFLDCLVLNDGDDMLSRNMGNNLPTYMEKDPWRAKSFDYTAAEGLLLAELELTLLAKRPHDKPLERRAELSKRTGQGNR